MNSLGIVTAEDKLKAISTLNYSSTLGDLEHYLSLTGYLRSLVGNLRKAYSSRYRLLQPTAREEASFQSLQQALLIVSILVYFDPDRIL